MDGLPKINGLKPFALKPPEPAESCGKCRFSLVDGPQLLCRRHPPQVTMVLAPGKMVNQMQPIALAAYPAVEERSWCGEWCGKASMAAPQKVERLGANLDALRMSYPKQISQQHGAAEVCVTAGTWPTVARVNLRKVEKYDRALDEAYEAIIREIAENAP